MVKYICRSVHFFSGSDFMKLISHLKRLLYFFLSGFILMFYSEYFFVNESPAFTLIESLTDQPLALVILGLLEFSAIYTFFGYILFITIDRFRINDLGSLFLAGILFGWWTEGIIIPVVYEAMPITIVWPSIGWHALVDVLFGWFFLRKLLQRNNYLLTMLVAVGMGLFWGVWASWFWGPGFESFSPDGFMFFTFFLTGFLMLAYFTLDQLRPNSFHVTRLELILFVLLSLAGLFLLSFSIGILPWIILVPLVGFVLFLLHRSRSDSTQTILNTYFTGRTKSLNALLLLFMPGLASLVYRWVYDNQIQLPLSEILPIFLTLLGSILFLLVSFKVILKKPIKQRRPCQTDKKS
jgi:hypothetical protein